MAINPQDFVPKPVVFVDCTGKEFTKMPGRRRKIPREVRKQIYELDRTVRECKMEIRKLLLESGYAECNWSTEVARIRQERGR